MSFKYRWLREISTPSEWFDFDREEKKMKNDDQKTPQFDDRHPEDEDFTACPACGSTSVEYMGEQYDDEHHVGSSYRCLECEHKFSDRDEALE